jgi:hypothetical protein
MSDDDFHSDDLPDRPYYEIRYAGLKQIIEAMVSYYPPSVLIENGAYQMLEAEFDLLASMLGYEDTEAMLERLIANDEADEEDDD